METIDATRSVCFTGHRPKLLYGYDMSKYKPLIQTMTVVVERLIQNGFTTFISGAAQGVDQLALIVLKNLKPKYPHIKNIVFVPFKNHHKNWQHDGAFGQNMYQDLLSATDEIRNISKSYTKDCYKKRDLAMVENSSVTIGVLKPELIKSGTAMTLRAARARNHPTIIIDPDTLKITCNK